MDMINLIGGLLYQWDTDRKVRIVPREGMTVNEVHFSHPCDANALPVEPYTEDGEIRADIPNILLQKSKDIVAYVVMHTDNGERTVCSKRLPVMARAKPSDYVYTETEVKRYETLEKRVAVLEKTGAAQADLSVNDETDPRYVKGRSHYEEVTEILEETALELDTDGFGMLESVLPIEEGLTYSVNWNGTEYFCECQEVVADEDNTALCLGNCELMGLTNTGEPFAIAVAEGGTLVVGFDESNPVTISITKCTVHKLDNKFINAEWMATKEVTEVDIIPEAEMEFGGGNNGAIYASMELAADTFTPGEYYNAYLNGQKYIWYCTETYDVGEGHIYTLQNEKLGVSAPRAFQYLDIQNGGSFAIAKPSTDMEDETITVRVTQIKTTVNKLDNEFLDLDWLPTVDEQKAEEALVEVAADFDNAAGCDIIYLENTFPGFTEGKKYAVAWNDAEHLCTASSIIVDTSSGATGIQLKSSVFTIIGSVSSDPTDGGAYVLNVVPLDGSTSATVSIWEIMEVANKLPNKYLDLDWLPVMEKGGELVNVSVSATTASTIDSGTYYTGTGSVDEAPAFTNGQEVVLSICNTGYNNRTDYNAIIIAEDSAEQIVPPSYDPANEYSKFFDNGLFYFAFTSQKNFVLAHQKAGFYTVAINEKKPVKMPEKFLPNNVPHPQTAEVGQFVKVTEIDENGKPTGYKSATPETVMNVTFTEDSDGFHSDKTYAEIVKHIDSGGTVVGILGGNLISVSLIARGANPPYVTFHKAQSSVTANSKTIGYITINVYDGDIAPTISRSIIDCNAVLKSGGTMTGPLTLSGAPTADLHASTKKYVDDSIMKLDEEIGKKITTPQTAEVGQAITVKAVDKNGVPTEWEATTITGGDNIDVDAELKEYYTTAKSNIRNSIEQKGVAVEDTDSLNDYAARILEIPSAVSPTKTIPVQTVLSAKGLQETLGIELAWNDVDAAGYLIVRKENLAPESTADGTTVYRGVDTGYTDVDVERGIVYYYRIFPYNDLTQYQATEEGSIARVDYVDRSEQVAIADLAVGDTIKFGQYGTSLYTWKVVDTQEKAKGWVTMCADQNLGNMMFDAQESATDNPNPISARKTGGNNRWLFSNIRQFLNSDAAKGEWYTAQHDYDVAPGYATTMNGFLMDFTDYEKNAIVPKTNRCVLDTNDGGGSETMIDKIWLPSTYAMGLEIFRPLEDDAIYEYFDSNSARAYTNNYWTRTINGTSSASNVRYVSSGGSLGNGAAVSNNAPRPFCLLPTSAYVRWSDSDSAYIFADDSQRNA